MTKPVGIQLSRRKGFNLQAYSRALNGLPAVNVSRPGKYGNPYRVGIVACGCRSAGECSHNAFNCETAAEAVERYRDLPRSETRLAQIKAELAGKNLGCWCRPGDPCHRNVLLELANR